MRTKITSLTAAAALVAASASTSSAAVILFLDQEIPIPTTFAGVVVNLETGATGTADAGATGADMNFVFGGEGITNDADEAGTAPTWQPVRAAAPNSSVIVNLGIDTVVDSSSELATGYGGSTTHLVPSVDYDTFTSGVKGYIGFSVVLADTTVAYGWAEVTLQDDDNTQGMIHGWAYEDDGTSLRVGAIPEPASTLLIALGFMASALRRRR